MFCLRVFSPFLKHCMIDVGTLFNNWTDFNGMKSLN